MATVTGGNGEARRDAPAAGPLPPAARVARWPYTWAVVVALIGALVTAALTVVSADLNASNERHLLALRGREVASALTSALPNTETALAAAAALGDATRGSASRFTRFASAYVVPKGSFISLSLWRGGDGAAGPVAVAGLPPELTRAVADPGAFLRHAERSAGLSVVGMLGVAQPRIGYAFSGSQPGPFVAYAESALPAQRFSRVPSGSAYSDLDFAIYLGRSTRRSQLVLTTVRRLPLPGRHQKVSIAFGDTALTIVLSARQPLGGSLPGRLPWGIAIVGALLTAGVALLTARLIRGRRRAQGLAEENRRLYQEQRGIAQAVQNALLPDILPELGGVELGARYEAGVRGIDIGGDWYDLIALDERRLLLVVGDVSGRGLQAATAMAALRFAIHYAAQEEPPVEFLPKLSSLRRLRTGGQLATVLCAVLDLRAREVTVTSAGHLPLLMISNGDTRYLQTEVGLPIGIDHEARYVSTTFPIAAGATLLGFTDGLVERRGEVLDDGLERLRCAAAAAEGPLEELMTRILATVRGPDSEDDTAIVAIRWLNATPASPAPL